MATQKWIGTAPVVAQVNTVTPASVVIGNTFTLTCNTKTITVTATAGTVANITALLTAAVNASVIAEFQEVVAVDNTTTLTLTARTAGIPFTITSAAATAGGSGTPTLVTSATTANSGPNDLAVAANWSTGSVPIAADAVVFDGSTTADAKWNLDAFSGFTLASITRRASYTGQIGLLDWNGSYQEYRPKYLQAPASTVTIGDGPGGGSNRFKWDGGSVQTAVTVLSTGSAEGAELEAVRIKGTHASNTLTVYSGSVVVAADTSSTSTIATLKIGAASGRPAAAVRLGPGCTLTTLTVDAGSLVTNSAFTTLNMLGGTVVAYGTGAATTITVDAGTLFYLSSGTITTLNVGNKGTADLTQDLRARTISNCTVYAGATLRDSYKTATFSAGIILSRCNLAEVSIDLGVNFTLTPS